MGLVSRMARPNARVSDYIEQKILEIYGGASTSSGVSVNSDTAMRLMTVQNCVRVRAATISQLPLHIMKRDGKDRNRAEDYYLYELLHDQPNSWMTAAEFWGMAEAYVATRGNFYAYKAVGTDGRVRELLPIPANMMRNVTQNPDYSLDYEIQFSNGEVKHLNNQQVMHLRGLVLNGFMGMNPIEYVREGIGLGLAGEKFLAGFFGKGMHPGVIFKHPLPLNAPAHANLKNSLKEKYAGLGQYWEMMLVDENMSVEFPQIKLVDAQFLELMKMTESQICGLFRVPLMLIQSGDKTPTYASAEQFMLSYSIYGVTPDVVNYEKAIRRDLIPEDDRKRYYAKFEVRALLRSSFKEQMESFATAIDKEIMNPNECRDLLDLNPYEGGDIYRTRTSTVKQGSNEGGEGNEPKVQE